MQDKSIKDHVLGRTLPDEKAALKELKAFLKPRVREALSGERSNKTVDEIVAEALQEDSFPHSRLSRHSRGGGNPQ